MNYDLFMSPSVVDNTARYQSGGTSVARPSVSRAPAERVIFDDGAVNRPPGSSASEPPTTEEVRGAVAAFNDVFEQANVGVRYRFDQDTGDLVITLVNRNTDEVLRQVPPDQILAMRQRLEELLGLIFDTTA